MKHELAMNSTINVNCETTVNGSVQAAPQTIERLTEAPKPGDLLLNLPILETYRVVAVEDGEIWLEIGNGCEDESISIEKAISFMWIVR